MNAGAGMNVNLRAKNGFATLQTALTFTETIGTSKASSTGTHWISTTGTHWNHTSTANTFIKAARIDLNE